MSQEKMCQGAVNASWHEGPMVTLLLKTYLKLKQNGES